MSDHHTPTVIVARRFAAGRERDGEEWLHRLRDSAAAMPGHLGSSTQPPGPQHPDEWVVVYRFASTELLDDWLSSPHRRELIEEGAELLVGEAREQVIALADESTSVTAVASFRLRADAHDAFRAWYRELLGVLDRFDGFIRSELVEPVAGTQDDTAIVFSFTDRVSLDRWLDSTERRDLLARTDELVDGERTINVVGGFAGWFSGPEETAPKRWKQATLVLVALYPTAVVLGIARDAIAPDLPVLLAVFLGNVGGVAILSWILMPALTRRFEAWLRR